MLSPFITSEGHFLVKVESLRWTFRGVHLLCSTWRQGRYSDGVWSNWDFSCDIAGDVEEKRETNGVRVEMLIGCWARSSDDTGVKTGQKH